MGVCEGLGFWAIGKFRLLGEQAREEAFDWFGAEMEYAGVGDDRSEDLILGVSLSDGVVAEITVSGVLGQSRFSAM